MPRVSQSAEQALESLNKLGSSIERLAGSDDPQEVRTVVAETEEALETLKQHYVRPPKKPRGFRLPTRRRS